jgi:SAM-dependent methyltransferase
VFAAPANSRGDNAPSFYAGKMDYQSHRPHQTPQSHLAHDHQPNSHHHSPDQHRGLDLDARVFGSHLDAALDLAELPTANGVIDLGAGTGVGSRLLRQRYPDATLISVDNDPTMLESLRHQGFTAVHTDLNEGFPSMESLRIATQNTLETLDLVWASSSLHHVNDPQQLLSGIRRALAPDGVLVVVELADLPSFLTRESEVSLEERCHAAARVEGWNQYPDWTPIIEAAGFSVTKSELSITASVTEEAREYAAQWLGRFTHLETLTPQDQHSIKELSLQGFVNSDLHPRATRTTWIARPH